MYLVNQSGLFFTRCMAECFYWGITTIIFLPIILNLCGKHQASIRTPP